MKNLIEKYIILNSILNNFNKNIFSQYYLIFFLAIIINKYFISYFSYAYKFFLLFKKINIKLN